MASLRQLRDKLDSIELIMAMYAGPDELSIDKSSLSNLEALSHHLDHVATEVDRTWSDASILLKLSVLAGDDKLICLKVLFSPVLEESGEQIVPQITLERPTWLTRRAFDILAAGLPASSADVNIPDVMNYVQSTSGDLARDQADIVTTSSGPTPGDGPLMRVWFYFPSLSTREKRTDLVRLAPQYQLTGFVLAGKPGVLCLEGSPDSIQAYVADIKCNSWGNIPSFRKKITERFREEIAGGRAFYNMREITDDIDRHGQRGNRGDLSQVEQFLRDLNLGNAFAQVFM